MLPVLFSVGKIYLYSFSVFIVIAWLFFSFIFWKNLKDNGVDEEKIFDLTFYSTIIAFITSRLTFVVFHYGIFKPDLLKIFTIWLVPGFTLYGALLGSLATVIFLVKKYKIRLGYLMDAFMYAFSGAFIVGSLGSFLDGSVVGKVSNYFLAVSYVGHPLKRYPVQLYEIFAVALILTVIWFVKHRKKVKWQYGLTGAWFYLLFSITMFVLEFLKDNSIYFGKLTVNQWVLIGIFCESVGVLYVKSGAKAKVVPAIMNFRTKSVSKIKGIYAKISQRNT
jgi:phosphatidylglycerol---prolipoprotein diacylglyceryl transferase